MLKGVSWLYGKIIQSRNSLYSRGTLKSRILPVPTISVGNITVGGTGKTPLVAYIAESLTKKGERVCIISRGYKRADESQRVLVSDISGIRSNPQQAGDEPFELAKRLNGKAIVVADKDRCAAAQWANERFDVSVFILDDAFQHRKAARALDLVVVDSTNPFGNGQTIPGGILREPLENLSRADAVVLSRTEQAANTDSVIAEIEKNAPGTAVFPTRTSISCFVKLEDFADGNLMPLEIGDDRMTSFCGIGNPGSFSSLLVNDDRNLADQIEFVDHHAYTGGDITEIESRARKKDAAYLVTTAKDAVKLKSELFTIPCIVCITQLDFEDKKGFDELVAKALSSELKN